MLFQNVGLGGSNFQITKSDVDNKRLAALLRLLADEICKEDKPEDKEHSAKFLGWIRSVLKKRIVDNG